MAQLTAVQQLRRQKTIYSWTGALLLVGIVLLFNFLVSYVPLRLDFSEGRSFSISRGTKDLLKKLDDTMIIRVMFSPDLPPNFKLNERYLRDLLAEYKRAAHGKIRVEFFDPSKSNKNRQDAIGAGVLPVQVDVRERDRREVKETFMGVAFFYGDKKEALPVIQDTTNLEYEITSRIKKLVIPATPKIGLITNGKSLTLSSEPLKMLGDPIHQLYETVDVDITKDIPTDVKSLWLLGPEEPLKPEEIARLKSFVQSGGILGMLIDRYKVDISQFYPSPLDVGLTDLLAGWGVEIQKGLIADLQCDRIQLRTSQGMFQMINVVDYPYFPYINDFDHNHPATKGLDGVTMPFVSPVEVSKSVPGFTYTPLLKTSRRSWLDEQARSVSPMNQHDPEDGAKIGPFNAALMVEGKFGDGPNKKLGRVMIFGCSRFIRTDYPPRQTNYALFLNLLDWSAQDEFLLSIRAKGVPRKPIRQMSDGLRLVLKYVMVVTLPILSILIGLVVWQKQKRRLQALREEYQAA